MNRRFFLGFLLLVVVIAGALSYFADSSPDGLDYTVLKGCRIVDDQLTGSCVAQATDATFSFDTPLADYTVGGSEGTTGLAGVIGVVITLGLAGGLFWFLRKRPTADAAPERE